MQTYEYFVGLLLHSLGVFAYFYSDITWVKSLLVNFSTLPERSMSLAWLHINNALNSLTGPEPQRERLFNAYTESLSKLTRKDLPSEIQPVFNTLNSHFFGCVWTADRKTVQRSILAMEDGEISAIIQHLIYMHGVVASYQGFSEPHRAS